MDKIDDLKQIVSEIISDIEEMESIDIRKNYIKTVGKIKRQERFIRLRNILYKSAAVIVLPLFISSAILFCLYFHSVSKPIQYAEISTLPGCVLRYELPDKSVVWLNSGSRLKYPLQFKGDKREVFLAGEGYFQVKADKKHPFYVDTPSKLRVFVYGTHFDVNAYSDDNAVETVLEEGKVYVMLSDRRSVYNLYPGESLKYDKMTGGIQINDVDIDERTAWKDGKLVFRNATLEEIFRKLERRFNVRIHFNNLSGKVYHYRATFRDETLSEILDYLSQSSNMKWKIAKFVQKEDSSLERKNVNITLY